MLEQAVTFLIYAIVAGMVVNIVLALALVGIGVWWVVKLRGVK